MIEDTFTLLKSCLGLQSFFLKHHSKFSLILGTSRPSVTKMHCYGCKCCQLMNTTASLCFKPTRCSVFRYPFYMLACVNTEWKTLTWLRYTVWIPLYPLGVLAEGELVYIHLIYSVHCHFIKWTSFYSPPPFHVAVAVIQSIPIFDKTKLFSIPLPKVIGTSVSFSFVLHVYLVLMVLGKSAEQLI